MFDSRALEDLTAAELVERVKAAEGYRCRICDTPSWEAHVHDTHLLQMHARAETAEATIARVRELADSFEVEWPTGPDRDGATVAHLIRQALNRNA